MNNRLFPPKSACGRTVVPRAWRSRGAATLAASMIALSGFLGSTTNATIVAVGDPATFDFFNHHYRIQHMPDFDQLRSALLNSGRMHCAPTSGTNLLTYVAHHFDPGVLSRNGFIKPDGFDPDHDNWKDWEQNFYNVVTDNIKTMATRMQKPPFPNAGVWPLQMFVGMQSALDGSRMVVSGSTAFGMYAPNFIYAWQDLKRGYIPIITYTYYQHVGNANGFPVLVSLNAAHVVTMTGVMRNENQFVVWVNDPGTGQQEPGPWNSQSKFNEHSFTITTGWVWIVNEKFAPNLPPAPPHLRYVSRMKPGPKDDLFGGIPKEPIWTVLSTVVGVTGPKAVAVKALPAAGAGDEIVLLDPFEFGGEVEQTLPSPSGTAILDLALHPNGGDVVLLTAAEDVGPATVWILNPLSGDATAITEIDNASRLAVGRNRLLYVLAGDELHRLHLDSPDEAIPDVDELPDEDAEIGSLDPIVLALSDAAQAIDFDDLSDEVVLLSLAAGKIVRVGASFDDDPVSLDLPPGLPAATAGDVAVHPSSGVIWLVINTSDSVYGLELSDDELSIAETIERESIVSPRTVAFDDAGHLFVATAGAVVELAPAGGAAGEEAGWEEVEEPLFDAEADRFLVLRSRHNFHPVFEDPEKDPWTHPEPPIDDGWPAMPCRGDFNNDETVNVQDLLVLLATWGPMSPEKNPNPDLDFNAVVNVFDLLELLALWGPCP